MHNNAATYLETLFETGSFSAAAKRLQIAQPTITQFIQRLERDWKIEVVDRSVRPMRVTPEGARLLVALKRIEDEKTACQDAIGDMQAGVKGHIRLGVSEYRELFFLPDVLPVFQKRYPEVELTLIEGTTDELEARALAGDVDVSITIAPAKRAGLIEVPLFAERTLLAIPATSPLLKELDKSQDGDYPVFDFQRLNGKPFLIVKDGQRLHEVFLDLCRQTGTHPKVVLESESLAAALALAGSGLGATLVPDYLAKRFMHPRADKLRYFNVSPNVNERSVVAIYRQSRYVPKALDALIGTMKEIALKA